MALLLRIRHADGISTLEVDEDSSVALLQQKLAEIARISSDKQLIKAGYPPYPLTLIPDLPIQSLGLRSGDQLILSRSQSAPPPPSSPPAQPTQSAKFAYVTTDAGYLIHRVVPDDNSCLFSSIALAFGQPISDAPSIRQIVANAIKADPVKYNDAILGMPQDQYIAAILRPATWGGAIELTTLADHFNTHISSIDVETGRIDSFDPTVSSGQRCILIYSGIHYDTVSLAPELQAPDEWHQTLFPILGTNDPMLMAASELATQLRAKRAYTNTNTFDLKCQDCGIGLKGEKNARTHAQETGHVNFGEY